MVFHLSSMWPGTLARLLDRPSADVAVYRDHGLQTRVTWIPRPRVVSDPTRLSSTLRLRPEGSSSQAEALFEPEPQSRRQTRRGNAVPHGCCGNTAATGCLRP